MPAATPPDTPLTPEAFAALTGADERALADLEIYRARLEDWNQRMNLVGPATLPAFWSPQHPRPDPQPQWPEN